jgi:DNA repair photolyase
MPDRPRHGTVKGRGATSNIDGRFTTQHVELEPGADPDEVEHAPETVIHADPSRSIISRNRSPDVPFDYSINPYKGCEHGCIYCYARPSHAYLDLSPGLDFETQIYAKREAPALLRAELSKPSYRCSTICMGANTDPYQPAERDERITRGILEVCLEFGQPITVITKGSLIERDIDLLSSLAERNLTSVAVSLTTMDESIKRTLEPRAASGKRRLEVIRKLAAAGVPVTTLIAPVIPVINEHELEALLEAAHGAGARRAAYIFIRLPDEVAPLFKEWLAVHYPDRAEHVMSVIRQRRGGYEYENEFGQRMRGSGPFAELLHQRFTKTCTKLGLEMGEYTDGLDASGFRVPSPQGDLF